MAEVYEQKGGSRIAFLWIRIYLTFFGSNRLRIGCKSQPTLYFHFGILVRLTLSRSTLMGGFYDQDHTRAERSNIAVAAFKGSHGRLICGGD